MGWKNYDPRLQIAIGLLVALSGVVIVGLGVLGIGKGDASYAVVLSIPMLAVGAFIAKRGLDRLGGEED